MCGFEGQMSYLLILRYNARICTGLGPWVIVVPVGATMLVLFALMAMTALVRDAMPVLVLEMLGSILMAFVGVNLLRPEYHYNTLETVLTRPVSFRVILSVRVLLGAVLVLLLEILLGVYIRDVMNKPLNLSIAIPASAASMTLLTALALAVAAAWRSPISGFVTAAGFWALDLLAGPRLHPLFTLRGYSAHIAFPEGEFRGWYWGKLVLLCVSVVLIALASKAASRPRMQRSLRRYLRTGALGVLVLVVYVWSGAALKVRWGEANEAKLLNRSRLWYRTAFAVYGPLPVPYLFGPAFAHFVGYEPPRAGRGLWSRGLLGAQREVVLEQLKTAAFGYPKSRWADNALYELGRTMLANLDEGSASSEDPRLGIHCLEQLANEYPSSPFAPPALERLAYAYEQMGIAEEARKAADQLIERYPGSRSAVEVCHWLLDRVRGHQAVETANKMLRAVGPDDRPELLLRLGYALQDLRQYDEAATAFQEAAEEATARLQALGSGPQTDANTVNLQRHLGDVAARARQALQTVSQSRN